ncbi:MAG: Gfo/Idh/MocA family oxidoreductase [Bdellovibrionales bacterium]|nr:Gfo/Idh/MocA family oxidoreductase [Bdellovibrionales bacterium]
MASLMKCAVVGVGYLGTFHAQKYKKLSETCPEIELVGVYDANPEQAQRVAGELGVKAFATLEEVRKEAKAVTIAVSTKAHYEVASFFLKNNIAVNVEKPMTSTLVEAEALAKLVEQTNGSLSVGHIERFNPSILELKRLLENPLHFELKRLGPFRARGADVNVLYDLMIHDIDLALWLTGSEPESWIASGSRLLSSEWDTCQVALKMKNGMKVSIEVSRVSPVTLRSIKATQPLSVLTANTGTQELTEVMAAQHPHHHLEVRPFGDTHYQPSPKLNDGELLAVRSWTVEKKDALLEETRAFVHANLHKIPMPVSAEEGLRAMKWTAAIEKDLSRNS